MSYDTLIQSSYSLLFDKFQHKMRAQGYINICLPEFRTINGILKYLYEPMSVFTSLIFKGKINLQRTSSVWLLLSSSAFSCVHFAGLFSPQSPPTYSERQCFFNPQ